MSQNGESNPLLDINFQIPFDGIRAEHVEPAIDELLADARARLEAIAQEKARARLRTRWMRSTR